MNSLMQDVRYAARMLARSPGFTTVAVLTLALGIGATTAMFSVVYGVLLRPLPYPEPERIVHIYQAWSERPESRFPVSIPNFLDWQEHNEVFSRMAAYLRDPFIMTGAGEPTSLYATAVSADYFILLQTDPLLGRTFIPTEFQDGENRVAILGYEFWQSRLGGAPDILNRTIRLSDIHYTVVGVMPPTAGARIDDPLFFVPLVPEMRRLAGRRGTSSVSVLARLRPGITLEQAQANLDAIAHQLSLEYPETNRDIGATVTSLHEATVQYSRRTLLVLFAVVMFVLLIACANVANLLLARASAREREFAIRSSLGAGRARLIRQTLTESGLLALLGAVPGLLLAVVGIEAFLVLRPPRIPRLDEITVDTSVLGIVLGVSVLTGLIFGVAPAFSLTAGNLAHGLKSGSTTSGAGRRDWLRNTLIFAQVSLAIVLLLGVGLMMKSFLLLQQVDPGIQIDNLLTCQVTGSRAMDPLARKEFLIRALDRLREVPGVEAAAATTILPLEGGFAVTQVALGRTHPGETDDWRLGDVIWASPGYFEALSIPLLRGRTFVEADNDAAEPVAIIDAGLAKKFWGDEDPVGRFIFLGMETELSPRKVVGLVADVHYGSLRNKRRPKIYIPYLQTPQGYWKFLVRSTADPAALAKVIKSRLWDLDPDLPIEEFRTGEDLFGTWLIRPRLYLVLFGVFAGLAAIMAMVGIYGVMAHFVQQRTHEIGVRMALGAQRGNVLRMVLRQGMTLTAIGIAAGLVASYWLTKYLKSFLFEVEPTDPSTFAAVAVLLAAVALLACWIPARRATRVDPMTALRYE